MFVMLRYLGHVHLNTLISVAEGVYSLTVEQERWRRENANRRGQDLLKTGKSTKR